MMENQSKTKLFRSFLATRAVSVLIPHPMIDWFPHYKCLPLSLPTIINSHMQTKQALLTKQIEYYLSDQNLVKDTFFVEKIQESKDGYINIAHLLNCNNIKKQGITKQEDLREAIKNSKELELHPTDPTFRRKDNKPLPEKTVKTENNKEAQNTEENPFKNIETTMFTLDTEKEDPNNKITFKVIQEALLRTYNLHPPYTRFNKIEGNFALNNKDLTEEITDKIIKGGLDAGNIHINIRKTEGKELTEFNEKHGHHYAGIIGLLKKNFDSKKKEERRNKARQTLGEVSFAGEKYQDINKVKSIFKNILCKAVNNKQLEESQKNLIIELVKFHDRAEEKLKDLKEVIVDINKDHPDTRCFYLVKSDGAREDFSVVKCINNLEKSAQ